VGQVQDYFFGGGLLRLAFISFANGSLEIVLQNIHDCSETTPP
jgi:hypothetical protein